MRQPSRAASVLAALTVALACAASQAGAASSGGPTARATAPQALAPARIYVSLPREGADAPEAARISLGLRAALSRHDAQAGGRPLRIVWLDDARGDHWSPAAVVADAERAAADRDAIAYVGERNSAATALAMPILNRAGLTHLSPVSTASDLTAGTTAATLQPTGVRTFFRPFPSDARQAAALLGAVRTAKAGGRVVTVDDGGVYGRDLTGEFRAEAAGTGVRVLGHDVAETHGQGAGALVRRLVALRPSAVVLGTSHPGGAARLVRALHRASPATLVFGGDALATDAFARRVGTAGRVVRLTAPAAHVDPRGAVARTLGADADPSTVFAHNGMTALLHAADRAGRTAAGVTRESVRRAVFSGHLQSGLSGAWLIDARGDAVYGAYDEVRVARGRITTPISEETALLLRATVAKRQTSDRTTFERLAPLVPAQASTSSINMANIQSMDIETALMMIQAERTKLLDAQLQTQIAEVQARNEQVTKLNTTLTALTTLRAWFPSGAAANSTALQLGGDLGQFDTRYNAVKTASDAAGTDVGLPAMRVTLTPATVDAAITTVKGMIDAASNSQQMDLLRLQSMTNKRNEAFDVMTNFVKKMQDSRASILANLR